MSEPREVPLGDAFSKWANNNKDVIKQQSLIKSSDFLSYTDHTGTHLSLKAQQKYIPTNYLTDAGNWNISQSYNIGDVVRVLPDVKYSLDWGFPPPKLGTYNEDMPNVFNIKKGVPNIHGSLTPAGSMITFFTYPYFVPVAGTYKCVCNVPNFEAIYQFFLNKFFAGSMGETLKKLFLYDLITQPFDIQQFFLPYLRFINVNYYPVWPELPNIAKFPTIGSSDLRPLNGRYWELMSLLPTISKVCDDNGRSNTTFVDAQKSVTSANYSP